MSKYTNYANRVWHGMLYGCTHMATMSIKGLKGLDYVLGSLKHPHF